MPFSLQAYTRVLGPAGVNGASAGVGRAAAVVSRPQAVVSRAPADVGEEPAGVSGSPADIRVAQMVLVGPSLCQWCLAGVGAAQLVSVGP